jgi:hypothetical protein
LEKENVKFLLQAPETLTIKKAIEIANYHLRRNEVASLSCRKRKLAMFLKK